MTLCRHTFADGLDLDGFSLKMREFRVFGVLRIVEEDRSLPCGRSLLFLLLLLLVVMCWYEAMVLGMSKAVRTTWI